MPTIALVAAGNRLGLSLGRIFGSHGFDVALVARSPQRLDALTAALAAEGVKAVGFPADATDPAALTAALDGAAQRFGRIDVLHYATPTAGSVQDVHSTGPLDVTVDNLRPQMESICYGAVTATRAVLPGMLGSGAGTLLFTTGASAVTPLRVFVSSGMAGAALRNWALSLHSALADKGIHVAHVAIGAWIAGTPGVPDDVQPKDPDDIARVYWDLHTRRDRASHLLPG